MKLQIFQCRFTWKPNKREKIHLSNKQFSSSKEFSSSFSLEDIHLCWFTTIHYSQITCFLDSNSATSSTSAASAFSLATKNEKGNEILSMPNRSRNANLLLMNCEHLKSNLIFDDQRKVRGYLLSHFRLQLAVVQLEPVKIIVAFCQHQFKTHTTKYNEEQLQMDKTTKKAVKMRKLTFWDMWEKLQKCEKTVLTCLCLGFRLSRGFHCSSDSSQFK